MRLTTKDAFLMKYGTAEHIDPHVKEFAGGVDHNGIGFMLLKNPAMTHEHHEAIIDSDHLAPVHHYRLLEGQPHMKSAHVERLAAEHGSYVGRLIYHHPNTTSKAIDHVIGSLVGDDQTMNQSNTVKSWKAKRDALKAAGK